MIKFHLSLLITLVFLNFSANANKLNNTKEQNLTFVKLVKVNEHTITSNILGPKKLKAFIYKFNSKERTSILNQLINDEIAVQYAWKYLKIDDNISNEKKRLELGLKHIHEIAITESIKTISDSNASSFYKNNKKKFWHEKHYEASHILVYDKNISIKLLEKLKGSSDLNSTFKKLAQKFSKDRSSKYGGYLGHFESKIMVKPFKDALENLKIGKYTQKAIRTRFGYHIILLHDIEPKGYIPFERIKNDIKFDLANQYKNRWFEKTLLPLKEKAKIHYFFDINKTYIKKKL